MVKKEDLEVLKMSSVFDVFCRVERYEKEGFDPKITKAILVKKLEQVNNAKSKKEIEQIMKSPFAFDDSGVTIPEEEMLIWSKASLKAPLNLQATNRYLDLVRRFYPESGI